MPEPDCFLLYALQRGILLRQENPTYRYWLQRRVVLQWFYSPRAVGTTLSEAHALYRVPFYLGYVFASVHPVSIIKEKGKGAYSS